MGNINSLQTNETLDRLKYTILRRAICYGNVHEKLVNGKHDYTREDLERLCYEIEGNNLEELESIHEKWIGY